MMNEAEKNLDLESFGEIMDEIITKSEIHLLISKEKNSDEYKIEGSGILKSAVMQYFVYLNGFAPIYLGMCSQMGDALKPGSEIPLLDSLLEGLRESVVKQIGKVVVHEEDQ